jgi:hypothetical protein
MKNSNSKALFALVLLLFPTAVLAHGPSAALAVIALICALLPVPTAILFNLSSI